MIRVFLASGQYVCIVGADVFGADVFEAVASALQNPMVRSRVVLAVTFDEDPLETAHRLGLK